MTYYYQTACTLLCLVSLLLALVQRLSACSLVEKARQYTCIRRLKSRPLLPHDNQDDDDSAQGCHDRLPRHHGQLAAAILSSKLNSDASAALGAMLRISGKDWPPVTSYDASWPAAMRGYHAAYKAMSPSLSKTEEQLNLNDEEDRYDVSCFRAKFRSELAKIDKEAVRALLIKAETDEDGEDSVLAASGWNGLWACIALSRHMYRWGRIPVTKITQEEKLVCFPPELDLVWPFLQRRFGFSSLGGNITSNYLCNFDPSERIVYEINDGLPAKYREAEYYFGHIFYAIEKLTLPLYHEMARSIEWASQPAPPKQAIAQSLERINAALAAVLGVYYDTMREAKIPRALWLRYAQGFQGWGCGGGDDRGGAAAFVEYEGLSGNQLPVFMAVDAFLGYEAYLSDENLARYVPAAQRRFIRAVRGGSFRAREGDVDKLGQEVASQFEVMVGKMKAFRRAHRSRVRPYLSQPAPERLVMTAGILENGALPTIGDVLKFLDGMLLDRLRRTV